MNQSKRKIVFTAAAVAATALTGTVLLQSQTSSLLVDSRSVVVQSFPARQFIPKSGPFGLFANQHWQTIIGSGALQTKFFGMPKRPFESCVERFTTADGDFFDVEFVESLITDNDSSNRPLDSTVKLSKTSSKGIVVILHGLESNTRGMLVTNMATAFLERGFSCCLVSFRGCGGELNLTPGAYHVGFTSDVNLVCQKIQERNPNLPIYLSGFSLGGNVILKFLGELGETAQNKRNIYGAAVTCVPFDPSPTQKKVDAEGFNKLVYAKNFLKSLKKKAEIQHKMFPNAFDIERLRNCSTIGEFDDCYIAPIYGFDDFQDYYKKSASKQYLKLIRTPAIAINAIDDPLIDENSLPNEIDIGPIAPVRLIYHANGGHCGFDASKTSYTTLYSSNNGTSSNIDTSNSNTNIEFRRPIPAYGWLADELARAIDHIHLNTNSRDIKEKISNQSPNTVWNALFATKK